MENIDIKHNSQEIPEEVGQELPNSQLEIIDNVIDLPDYKSDSADLEDKTDIDTESGQEEVQSEGTIGDGFNERSGDVINVASDLRDADFTQDLIKTKEVLNSLEDLPIEPDNPDLSIEPDNPEDKEKNATITLPEVAYDSTNTSKIDFGFDKEDYSFSFNNLINTLDTLDILYTKYNQLPEFDSIIKDDKLNEINTDNLFSDLPDNNVNEINSINSCGSDNENNEISIYNENDSLKVEHQISDGITC